MGYSLDVEWCFVFGAWMNGFIRLVQKSGKSRGMGP